MNENKLYTALAKITQDVLMLRLAQAFTASCCGKQRRRLLTTEVRSKCSDEELERVAEGGFRRVRRVLRQMCLQPAHLAHKLQDHRFRVPDPSRLLDDLLTLLGKASVSIVDGLDFSIEIRFATPSIEFRREAVNAY